MAHSRRYDVSSTRERLPSEKENREDNIAMRVKSRKRLSSEGVPGVDDTDDAKLSSPTIDAQDSKLVTQLPQKKESVRKKSKPSGNSSPETTHRIGNQQCTRSEEELEMITSIQQLAKYGEKEVGKKAEKKKSFIQKLKNTSRHEVI